MVDSSVIAPSDLEAWLEFRRRAGVERFELWQIRAGQAARIDEARAEVRDAATRWAARARGEAGLCIFAYNAGEDAPCLSVLLRAPRQKPFSDTSKIDRSIVTGGAARPGRKGDPGKAP